MPPCVKTFAADEDGATAIEYGLIAGLIMLAILAAVTLTGADLSAEFNGIAAQLAAATPAA